MAEGQVVHGQDVAGVDPHGAAAGPDAGLQRARHELRHGELVAEAYQRMGFLGEDTPSNEYTPRDFSDAGGLELMKGALSQEMSLKS